MIHLYRLGGLLAALLVSASVYAGDIQVENAWARATAPGQDVAGVDLTITSKQAAILIGVSSPVCKTVELHSMTMPHGNGMMKMHEVDAIELPAGKPVNLRASGYHLMLTGLKAPLKAGESVPLTLNIKVAKHTVKVKAIAEVKAQSATNATTGEMHHQDH
jgi:copper(I)-binding protein